MQHFEKHRASVKECKIRLVIKNWCDLAFAQWKTTSTERHDMLSLEKMAIDERIADDLLAFRFYRASKIKVWWEDMLRRKADNQCIRMECSHAITIADHRTDYHDDVIKWKRFPRNWPFVRGIHRSPVNSPQKRPVTRSFDVFFDLRLNKRLSIQWWCWWFETPSRLLWRNCNEYMKSEWSLMSRVLL